MFFFLLLFTCFTPLNAVLSGEFFLDESIQSNIRDLKKAIQEKSKQIQQAKQELNNISKEKNELEIVKYTYNIKENIVEDIKDGMESAKNYLKLGGLIHDRVIIALKERLVSKKDSKQLKKDKEVVKQHFLRSDDAYIAHYLAVNYCKYQQYALKMTNEDLYKFLALPKVTTGALLTTICKSREYGSKKWLEWFLKNDICTANTLTNDNGKTILMKLIWLVVNSDTNKVDSELISQKMLIITKATAKPVDCRIIDKNRKTLDDYFNYIDNKKLEWKSKHKAFISSIAKLKKNLELTTKSDKKNNI